MKTATELWVHLEQVQNTNMADIAEQRYVKELNKTTYYVGEIKENLGTGAKEDLQLAYESEPRKTGDKQIC